ncbi:MAG: hypothetical protein ACYTF0_06850, partial [Planctomycetota bacterium]
ATATDNALSGLVLTSKPTDAVTITALKANAPAAGASVTVQGRIGGRAEPFIPGRAAFLLADDTVLIACDASPDDPCPIAWDYCCEPGAKLTAGLATVQVIGDDGRPLATDLAGLDDLKPGSYVVINGTIANSEGSLIINCSGIFHDRERRVVPIEER